MNDSEPIIPDLYEVILLIGSNIDPLNNIAKVLLLLESQLTIIRISRTWETAAIGSTDANFLNLALIAQTNLGPGQLKTTILLPTESVLGRVRTSNKNEARTMDLDIIIYNHSVLDQDLWKKAFISLPVADLVPELPHPGRNKKLLNVATRLQKKTFAVVRDDIIFNF